MTNGGPAFPVEDLHYEEKTSERHLGMSLRDCFAAKALVGYIAAYAHPNAMNTPGAQETAAAAYRYADEMLAEREK